MARLGMLGLAGATALMLAAQPARADVKAGVDAWSLGDYAQAVREWQGPAEAGDPDALFNLAQAYRLGRGVPVDEAKAEGYYARAAAKGHVQAADTYGLMLFQSGRREMALPYVEDAARRGDPRSQYLLGIAHFNGDLVPQDWVRAYALLTLANSAGLPQAAPALAQMDEHIPLGQRQQAAALAQAMRAEADSTRGRELATAELAMGPSATVTMPTAAAPSPPPPPAAVSTAPSVEAAPRSASIPRPIPQVEVSPSIAAAQAAVAEATRVTGTENPAYAGADFTLAAPPPPASGANARPPAPTPAPPLARPPAPPPPARASAPAAQPAVRPAATGPWRVQLGAFSVAGNADRLWARLASRPELAGRTKLTVPAGRVTKLQAGGYATQSEAEAACRSLQSAGQDCLVTTR